MGYKILYGIRILYQGNANISRKENLAYGIINLKVAYRVHKVCWEYFQLAAAKSHQGAPIIHRDHPLICREPFACR